MAQASGSGFGRRHEDPPGRGSEVFVGGLSRSVSEKLLAKLFSPFGEILDLRIMKDVNGTSKGFCFIRYSSKDAALAAVKGRDGFMLNGKQIGVAFSSDRDTLFLGNLSKEWSLKGFDNLVRQTFKDVLSTDLALPSSNQEAIAGRKRLNRGFGFVQFISHAAAARALRVASDPGFILGDVHPAVEWAEKEPELDPEEMAKIKVAFVGNLPIDADEEYLRMLFEPYGELEKVALSRKGHFPVGFVHFARRSDLDGAIRMMDGKTVHGPHRGPSFQIQVSIAKPKEKDQKRSREDMNGNHDEYTTGFKSKVPKHEDVALDVIDPYEEAVVSLPLALKDRLLHILRMGIATRYDIDIHCISGLRELPASAAVAVLDQFMVSGREKHDKGAYFYSMIAAHQGRRNETSRRPLEYSRSSFDAPIEKSEMLPPVLSHRPMGGTSTRLNSRHSPPRKLPLPPYASPPPEPFSSRTVLRLRKMSPPREAAPSSMLGAQRGLTRLDSVSFSVAEQTADRPQFRFDPYTGKRYKFDPFTGEPIQEPPSRRPGGYY